MILITPVLLIQLFTTYIFFERHWNQMTDRLAFSVAGEIAVIADRIAENPARAPEIGRMAEHYLDLSVSFQPAKPAWPDDKEAPKVYRSWGTLVYQTLSQAMNARTAHPYAIRIEEERKLVHVALALDNGQLNITIPQRRLFSSSARIFLLWMLGSSVVLVTIAILFLRNQVRPIRRLAIAAERIGKGRDVPFFKPEGAREVRQAAQAFLDMRERINRQIAQRTSMLAGVSHDLRTPLTRMKLQAEILPDSPDVQALKNDILDMERMIDAYLQFARGEGGEETERTDLTTLLQRCAEGLQRTSATTDIALDIEENLSLPLRPIAFERCIGNLLSNAAKHAPKIWVHAEKTDEEIRITIDDNGPGVPENQYEEVFKPFIRGDTARSIAKGDKPGAGVGLGLPIAQDIVFAHGGDIALDRAPQGGLRVILTLPA